MIKIFRIPFFTFIFTSSEDTMALSDAVTALQTAAANLATVTAQLQTVVATLKANQVDPSIEPAINAAVAGINTSVTQLTALTQ